MLHLNAIVDGRLVQVGLDETALEQLKVHFSPEKPRPMTRIQFAERHGICLRTVDKAIAGGMDRIKIGRRVLIDEAAALRWLKENENTKAIRRRTRRAA